MLNSLYVSASGMLAELRRQDIVANNLANAATNGYKRDIGVSSEFPLVFQAQFGGGTGLPVGTTRVAPIAEFAVTDFAPGAFRSTGNPLDLALAGNGFFALQTPEGLRYTRNGNFQVDSNGILVTSRGEAVLGINGAPINVGTENVVIQDDGQVLSGNQVVGQIQIAAFQNPLQLLKAGDGKFTATAQAGQIAAEAGQLKQGFLEASNVNPIREMVAMIEIQRAFEASQRVIKTTDRTLEVAVTQVGRV